MPSPYTRFLIVHQVSTLRRIVRSHLKQLGYQNVDEADDGAVALARLRSEEFGFVVADRNTLSMDGLTLVQNIRADPQLTHIPVLLVTASAQKEFVLAAAQAGANDYIVSPFAASAFADKLNGIFAKMQTTG